MNCSSSSAWCSANSDTAGSPHKLCIQATSNGSTVTALSQSDNGQANLNVSAKPYNYVVTDGNVGLSCPVNSNGTLSACTTTGSVFSSPFGIGVNPDASILYVANRSNGSVSQCPIDANTGLLGTCTTAVNGLSGNPQSVTISPDGTLAYITTLRVVLKCPVNSNGSLGTCADSGNGNFANTTEAVAINADNTFAYVTSINASIVTKCTITAGSFSNCASTGSNINQPFGIVINSTNTFSYVVNFFPVSIGQCPIDSSGSFGACVNSGATTLNGTSFMTLNNDSTVAYLANNFGGGTVSKCTVNISGALGSCVNAGTPVSVPRGIVYAVVS